MNTVLNPKLVIDTPNVLFYHKHRKGQIDRNLLALLNFVLVNKQPMICVVTPLIMKKFKTEMAWIISIIEANHGIIIYSEQEDPDVIVLQSAEKGLIPILSNDKFRQSKYKKFKSRTNRINFVIRKAVLNIISKPRKIITNKGGEVLTH